LDGILALAAAAAADANPGAGADKLVFEAASQPMREDYVENAVKFLSHPKVRGSPVVYRRSFLEKKGLTTQEIDEAFRRVPVRYHAPPPWIHSDKDRLQIYSCPLACFRFCCRIRNQVPLLLQLHNHSNRVSKNTC